LSVGGDKYKRGRYDHVNAVICGMASRKVRGRIEEKPTLIQNYIREKVTVSLKVEKGGQSVVRPGGREIKWASESHRGEKGRKTEVKKDRTCPKKTSHLRSKICGLGLIGKGEFKNSEAAPTGGVRGD